jgi:O-antigen ligase
MIKLTTFAITLTAIGIFTSVSILGISQALFAVPVIYYFYRAYKDKNLELPKSTYWLLAFIGIACISLLINLDAVPRPTKNFGRLKYLLFGALGIFVFKYWLIESSVKVQKIVVSLFLFSVTLAAAYGSIKFFVTGEERLRGFTDTLRYGYGMGMTLLVILSAFLHREKLEKWVDPRLCLAAFIIGFVGLYFSYTRGAFLGFFCGLPFVCYFYSRKLGLTLGSLAVLVVLTLGGFYLFGDGNYGSRFLISKNNNSDNTRRSQWKAALIATQEKPVLGWGFSNYHSQLKRIKNDYDLDAKHYNDAHAHNLFLETSSGTGIVGLIVFLGFVITWALECFKAGGLTRALVVPFGVAWVVSSQFEMTFDANNASLIFLLYPLSCVLGVLSKNAKDIHSHA